MHCQEWGLCDFLSHDHRLPYAVLFIFHSSSQNSFLLVTASFTKPQVKENDHTSWESVIKLAKWNINERDHYSFAACSFWWSQRLVTGLCYVPVFWHLIIYKVSSWHTVRMNGRPVGKSRCRTQVRWWCMKGSWCFCYWGFIMKLAGGWIALAPAGGLRERMINIHTPQDCLLSHDSSTRSCWSNTCTAFISLLYSPLLRYMRLKSGIYSRCLNYRDLQCACLLCCMRQVYRIESQFSANVRQQKLRSLYTTTPTLLVEINKYI